MARKGARTDRKIALSTYEQFLGIKHSCTVVGAAVAAIPGTNLSYRKGLIVQNKHASNVLYLGGGIPYFIMGEHGATYSDNENDKRGLSWFKSGTGNEWYLAMVAKGDPSLTQVRYLYYALKTSQEGDETLATAGTVGTLAAEHKWGWGDGDTLGFNTLYIRTNGATPANSPIYRYKTMHAYYFVLTADDTAATGGYELGPRDAVNLPLDGSVRLFGIASAATTAVSTLEYV